MKSGKRKVIYGVRASGTLTSGWRRSIGLLCLIFSAAITSPAQDVQPATNAVGGFQTLFSFNGTNGQYPELNFVQGLDGNLYGTTNNGGTPGPGTVFKVTQSGTLTTVYNFCAQVNCTDGSYPMELGFLALDTDGSLYGTTQGGGTNGFGTIFKITPGGNLTTLYSFCSQPNCVDQGLPYSGVVRGADGNFYGVTPGGGLSGPLCGPSPDGITCGTVYKITPQGAFRIIYSFCSQANCTDGSVPIGQLVSGADGNLYGTTSSGGGHGLGTIFKITLSGKLTTLHSFDPAAGQGGCQVPCAPMIQATNGNFYGTDFYGGGSGTFFEITPAGGFTTLYNFCSQPNCTDGAFPMGIVQGTDKSIYGVTAWGGSGPGYSGAGTLFKISPAGSLTTLHTFNSTDGSQPSGLVQATNGRFYGETEAGDGTIFSFSVGLGPFVETLPTLGKVGELIRILGTNLTSVTGVSFNGTPAAFRVVSGSLILAAVPTGATSGFVTVTTSTSTLKSAVKFIVLP